MATSSQSPDTISLNSCNMLNFGDLYSIFCDRGAKKVEHQIEVGRIKEEMGHNLVITKVDALVMQRRLEYTEKKVHYLTVFVVGLVLVMFGFLVDKVHYLMNK
ncbi:unnamed protein product [Lactuca saligna]|uniref:Uncharacterized protein n=1 Tax=Lactuca saligna TaxID=75948 RepID=A0AA35VUI2_LACSI|nr:unnamed protein product [Lactuca saligna]